MTMKQLFFITIWCSITSMLMCNTPGGRYTYILKIQTPPSLHAHEPWLVMYKGQELHFQSNISTAISEPTLTFTFSILITSEMPQPMNHMNGAIPCLARMRGAPIRWFDVTLHSPVNTQESWSWNIRELTITEMPRRIPDHAIIFIYDPELIASLEQPVKTKYTIDTTHQGGRCTFELPTIRIKQVPAKIFNNACEQARLTCLDLRHYHARCIPRGRNIEDRCLFLDYYAS